MLELRSSYELGRGEIMVDPVEITEKDLLDRPLGGKPGVALTKAPGNILAEIKAGAKQVKEIIDIAKSLGLNLKLPPGLTGMLGQKGEGSAEPTSDAPGVAQFQAFRQLLIIKYGDITVNDLIDKLRAEMGNRKLSDLGGK